MEDLRELLQEHRLADALDQLVNKKQVRSIADLKRLDEADVAALGLSTVAGRRLMKVISNDPQDQACRQALKQGLILSAENIDDALAGNPRGDTALVRAAREGEVASVRLLLSAGAKVDSVNKVRFANAPCRSHFAARCSRDPHHQTLQRGASAVLCAAEGNPIPTRSPAQQSCLACASSPLCPILPFWRFWI